MLSRLSWVSFREDVGQQRHPSLLVVQVFQVCTSGFTRTFACHVSLLATPETSIDTSEMCSFFIGEFLELQRLGFDLKCINLNEVRCVVLYQMQSIQLHRFSAGIFWIRLL